MLPIRYLSTLPGCLALLMLFAGGAPASPGLPAIIGEQRVTSVSANESLMEVARRTGFGYESVAAANPGLDPWTPAAGTEVVLPGRLILPAASSPGLIINLAEMRLLHIIEDDHGHRVKVYPLGIGRAGRETPEGRFRIISKQEKPVWRVPEGLRAVHPELPELVPPGPGNPLGDYWLGLSAPGYGIHGTNRPLGVGRRVSYGCLRLYPEDIAELYDRVAVGTAVTLVYQPVKVAWDGDLLFIEVHRDVQERFPDLFQEALRVIGWHGAAAEVDYKEVQRSVGNPDGLLHAIGIRRR